MGAQSLNDVAFMMGSLQMLCIHAVKLEICVTLVDIISDYMSWISEVFELDAPNGRPFLTTA
jgi:hypothetical protein